MTGIQRRVIGGAGSLLTVIVGIQLLTHVSATRSPPTSTPTGQATLLLPSPVTVGAMSLEEALAERRSVRDFALRPLSAAQIGQLLWAAQGVTDAEGRRTAPSAGALYPLELYAVSALGTFRYLPAEHTLALSREGDLRAELQSAALGQAAVGNAPLVVVVVATPGRTVERYGPERAMRYVQLEAGHAAQNLLLQAMALGLGAVPVGAFDDARVNATLGLVPDRMPLYLLAIGYPLDSSRWGVGCLADPTRRPDAYSVA